jgi:drug/metabolite transporter (DMT)-like permease
MSARGWVLFAAVCVVWGVPYFFIKVAVDGDVPPAFLAWARVAIAAALLAPVAWRRGALRGLSGRWRAVAAYAACEIAIPFVLIAAGEQHISSSLTAILIASMPLLVALLSIRFAADDRPTVLRIAGLLVGLGGVVALLGIDVAGRPEELLGAALVLVATLGYATAPIIISRSLRELDPLGPVAAALGLAAVALLPAAAADPPQGLPGAHALLSIVVLGVVCTAAGLILFFSLTSEVGPGRASVITYVNPTVAVALGVIVLDEHVGAVSIAGLLLILVGSWLSTSGRPRRRGSPERAGGADCDMGAVHRVTAPSAGRGAP